MRISFLRDGRELGHASRINARGWKHARSAEHGASVPAITESEPPGRPLGLDERTA